MSSKIKIGLLLLCFLNSHAFSASVTWIDGQIPPGSWTVDPNGPGTSDTITFSGPLNFVYGSSCSARGALGGTPQITVDTVNKEVFLWFQEPAPTQCPAVWQPVSGLQGSFGPLAAGYWTFKCTVPAIAFEISFVVGTPTSTYYVDQDSPGPVRNGSNWYWAFSTIQDALAIAGPGDTILVAEGVYKPDQGLGVIPGDRSASFTLQDGISLIGGYAGFSDPSPGTHDPNTYITELSGDLASNDLYGQLNTEENSYHVLTAQGSGAISVILSGMLIQNGQANGNSPDHMGGGLLIQDANVVVSDSHFYGNKGAMGGAMAVNQGTVTLVNCRVSGNTALLYGAGFYALDSTVSLTNCLITGNTSNQAELIIGSVIHALNSNTTISNSTITDNQPPASKVISSLNWVYPPTNELTVTRSILYNGGNEIYTTHPSTTQVSNTDIQGGWSGLGTGNINADPLFVTSGNWSFESEWIAGDYHLQNGSPCLSPETYMGAYPAAPSPVDPDWLLVNTYNISDTPTNPWTDVQRSVSFTISVRIQSGLEELGLSVSPASAAGGDWTATFNPDPGILGPGIYPITIEVVGNHVDLSQLDMGVKVTLAKVQLLYRKIQP